ncbi:probable ubiquitin carboxyl-terminal hydrolase FAF isoform X1 [Lucilia cuprina]|uniref:probable ubiquitin carboxyl-terminal hydrolase FAF isoform X1 n=1 Tax=Lucilia cuprina TaxID=7375 RepID=UPI001F0581EC|nr:probable ubiquitin carboxyl-terminal hydrolase FAF isoform X1 [Lucilia cuprina]XP_046806552.1 probable ubiquitin carboxyl-terminal hydrolase FAF isoform X1 [Lucilia cuprina]
MTDTRGRGQSSSGSGSGGGSGGSGGGGGSSSGGDNSSTTSTSSNTTSSSSTLVGVGGVTTLESSSSSTNLTTHNPTESTTISATINPLTESPGASVSAATENVSPEKLIASFPTLKLRSLTQKISNPRWVVPVLPEQELEVLLNAAIQLTAAGVDHECEHCVEFYHSALTTSFTKILTDEAVNSWKYNIHHCILISCGKLLHLIAIHMTRDNPYLLDLLAIVFDPDNKFNTFNAARQTECFSPPDHLWGVLDGNKMFAKPPPEPKNPRGWLVDLINRFGQLGGFDNLQERFNRGLQLLRKQQEQAAAAVASGCAKPGGSRAMLQPDPEQKNKLTLALIYSLLRPFGQCYELLTPATISKYFMPIWNVVLDLLDSFSDEELKREAKPEGRNDYINGIVKSARYLASRLPGQEELIRNLEMFRLKMILRLLQVSSFNGKMNALNEINKVLTSVSYYAHRTPQLPHCMSDDDLDWLTAERMAAWIKESDVLGIVLKDSLHQPQYVEKLEKIIRFLIKEHALTLEDLDAVWRAQAGKHEAIVKNVHDLLAKLAWDFTPEQLDHLFESFQASMTTANKRQRERLLELIRRLAEDDKNGVMAQKVLKLFWTLAHSSEIPPEVLDQALAAHVKILDYSCSQERDAQKIVWLDKCVVELKNGETWVLPALRLIREICCLYESSPSHAPRSQQSLNRQQVIERLQNDHSLVILVTNSLTSYMDKIRTMIADMPNVDPASLCIDGRYPHNMQISERLDFLKFLLKDGQLWLCADQAKQIWHCLAVNAVFPSDREECFRWFGKLMGEEPDLDPGINKDFFENNILQLDPHLLTESGIKCFERFFKAVNSKEDKLKAIHRGYILDNEDLIGKDYLWRVITTGGEEIANKAIDLLKEVSTALGPRLQENISEFHEMFIGECCERLRTHYTNIMILGKSLNSNNTVPVVADDANQADQNESKDSKMRFIEAEKMCRILKVLQEYIKECDRSFNGDRYLLPLVRATRGKYTSLYIRFQNPGRPIDDIEIITHNNEMVSSFKRNLLKRIKGTSTANIKVDLYYNNGELIDIGDEINPLSQYSIRDKMILTAKLTPIGVGLASSPDTSSDSSTGSPPRPCPDMQRVESESTLPGVIISRNFHYIEFFLKLYQLGSDLEHGRLRESAKMLLHLLPCDRQTVKMLQIMCGMSAAQQLQQQMQTTGVSAGNVANVTKEGEEDNSAGNVANVGGVVTAQQPPQQQVTSSNEPINPTECTPEMLFLHPTPAQVHYNLCVFNSLLIPALDPYGEKALQIQSSWLHSGCAHFILELLTKNNFLPNADMHTKRASFQCVLRLAKLFLYIVGCVLSRVGDEPMLFDFDMDSRSQVEILKQILTSIPNTSEITLRAISQKLAENLAREMLSASPEGEVCRLLFASTLQWSCPDISTIKAVVQLAWASSCGNLQSLGTKNDFADDTSMPDSQDFMVCKEALEVLTISLVLNPSANEALSADPLWNKFITSLILKNQSRHVRQVAAEQLFLTCTYCAGDRRPFAYMVNLLVSSLKTLVPQHEATCADFFQLLCRTLSYGCVVNWPLNIGEGLLAEEIKWLQKIREHVTTTGDIQVHEDLLEGHLCLAKELMFFLSPETKAQLNDLIHELIDAFLFTASREYLHLRKTGKLKTETAPPPVCRSPHTIAAACDLLIALCQNCVPNMKLLTNTITDFVCTDTDPLRDWDYLPPVGARPIKGFCGLKNAGATCYMNSVLQQLYMVPSIRVGILKADGAATNENEDFSGEPEANAMGSALFNSNEDNNDVRKNYHVVILKHVQAIFAHLGHSALQFYVPRGLWTHFKLQGEPVNLREQQDAVEFFMSLFESLDEGLKALGQTQLMNNTLGGSFSDQKICQECPHRYSKEEPFSVFSVDIRNHSSLTESLEQYVKGELLEGADAYHCDKCDKKVVTIKRLCVKKLPPVLAIQLKRFEYDYERVCAIKFNDYFEFPRLLDMEPYTVSGLAKLEGEVIEVGDNCQSNDECTKYELTGIVVHSGQASGGHYFSYIRSNNPSTGKEQWYKFDDGDVTECKMNEDEEMKAQCFGGDYMGEIYDSNLKRMQYRRQKRWWNAYMLFYTRCDQKPIQFEASVEQLSLAESRNFVLPLPKPIERSVRNQNIRFLHSKSIFSVEFFNFIKKLVSCSIPTRADKMTPAAEELSLLGVQLASQFLFHTGFRTKKSLRGPVIEWYDTLSHHIRLSPLVRKWFASNALLSPPTRLGEYILMAPSPEVRTVFVKLVVFFCHFAINDEPLAGYDGNNLCEQILISVLKLLKCEVADHGKHLPHYFSLFSMYVGLGIQEKQQLLKLNVPVIFMQVALDEGPGPSIKYQYPELSKLHQVVSHLIRCSNISDRCQSSNPNERPLQNPFKDPIIRYEDLMPLSPECVEILFNRTGYIKKLIEDTNVGEEGLKLLQYCSWENPHFSRAVLTELLWQCGFAYCHDMRHHTELLLHILLIEDSWQHHRIHNALNGVAEEREGLLETIQRSKTHYQKRAYQIIKCLTQLFHKSPVALQMLNSNPAIGRHWIIAVEWLQDELDRQRGIGCQYNSYSWSPPAQSNDNTNGYMLERSHSAKNTWSMAYELCPEEEQEETNESDVEPIDEAQRQQQQQQQANNAATTTKTSDELQKEQELNHVADLIRNNMTVEESTQQQQQTGENLNFSNVPPHKSTIIVGLAPGSSIDWKASTFVGDSSSGSKKAFTSTTNTSTTTNTLGSSSSSVPQTSSTVAMTESQNETNINGLTSNIKQMSLSPKTSVSGVISSEATTTMTTLTGTTKKDNDLNLLNVLNNTTTTMTTTTINNTLGNNTAETQQLQQTVNTTTTNDQQHTLLGSTSTPNTTSDQQQQQQQQQLNTTTKT